MLMNLNDVVLLIPAYNPPKKLIQFTNELINSGFTKIIIINDGSDQNHNFIFEEIKKTKATLICHKINHGKGQALKTGMNFCLNNFEKIVGIITADSDGQHSIEDIKNIATKINQNELILGKRFFKKKDVPLKSRLGNFLSRKIISLVLKQKIYDTQTGLRAIPANKLKDFSLLPGKKYEFETNMLLHAKKLNLQIREIPIETIYINNNKDSHFRPIKDGFIIYKSIFKFLLKKH